MTMPVIDFWFDFASSYSYPAAMRAPGLAATSGIRIRYRPFLLGPIFKAQGWDTSPFNIYEAKGRYMWRDLERLCGELGIPFRRPSQFPQNSLLAARVAMAGSDETWNEETWHNDTWHDEFCRAVFRAQFGEGRRIDDPAVIGDLLSAVGAPQAATFERAGSDPIKQRLRGQTEEAGRLGIFGAPAFTLSDGEMFWGNDRLEAAMAWAKRIAQL